MLIACFGESLKGQVAKPYYLNSQKELIKHLGKPQEHFEGMKLAKKMLLDQKKVLFFKVEEEGLDKANYLKGLHFLKKNALQLRLLGIYLSGCFDQEVIDLAAKLCRYQKTLLLATEKEMIDYLTI